MKKKIKVSIERSGKGFSAHAKHFPVQAKGDSIPEIRKDIIERLNSHQSKNGKKNLKKVELSFQLDLPAFFHFYKIINAKALSERIGMHQSLLAQYISGKKTPSPVQMERIVDGVKEIAEELRDVKII
jgi:hypothetical protein